MIKLDFLALRENYIDHLAPVWNKFPMDRRGRFFVSYKNKDYAEQELGAGSLVVYEDNPTIESDALLVCSYGDLAKAIKVKDSLIITMEHGTGHTFGTSAYPNGKGKREHVDLAIMPNEYTARLARAVRDTKTVVIGTPKMDYIVPASRPIRPKNPVIAIAFHWGDRNSNPPESGSAWEYYKDVIPELSKKYKVIGHGHPLARDIYRKAFENMGIEYVENFRDVMERADVYINDLSSTLYEFLLTGKPVIVLNALWFRRDVHWGLRFWDYSNVGINVEKPADLIPAVDRTLEEYGDICLMERFGAVWDLYPNLGGATNIAIETIIDFLKEKQDETKST